ncbi:hypothetical protein DGG96_11705 [Legionella qingyii]|uniref:Uncharacterized protein n=1 Tax=Legionella qingyii TaxID=2184757 RepID=A0A317U3M0_9GAMM|nr:hypothetical protein [Legionella qingyii]PWY55437.1 hypothetical protein DGG96_11705 [Legionella qingyii]RUR21359.1 hypothetical protein ELY20_12730 [Legionella qingyii]RUR24583.1 hypothetical protein ELY16_11565 [Legionella qingyii]
MDKSWNKICTILLGAVITIGFSNLAVADDACKAKCEVNSKSCTKGCDGNTDCILNCSDTRDSCVQGCGD